MVSAKLALVAVVCLLGHSCSCLKQEAALGAYLGCFPLQHILSLAGVQQTGEAPHTHSTLFKCAAACRQGNFSLIIVSTELRCWCALATPDSSQQLQDSACNAGGQGAAVFYQDARAATHKCKVVPTSLTPDGMSVDYNQHNLEFTPAQGATGQSAQMRMRMEGSSGARVQPKAPKQMYGQFEVTAKVASAAGCVTAFYVRDSDEYNAENKGDFEEIDVEFLNADPGVPNSVWFNSYHRGLSRGERLTKPEQYQPRLKLPNGTHNGNTWLTYTITWQPTHVTWAINGVPLLRRTAGELVTWSDMKGRPFQRIFVSPVKPMHIAISMWNDNSRFHFGGELDYSKSPFYSFFRDLRRIACDDPLSANNTQPHGPTWLYRDAASWPKAPVQPYVARPLPSPSALPAPSPSPSLPEQVQPQLWGGSPSLSPSVSPRPQAQPMATSPAAAASPAAKQAQANVGAQSPSLLAAPSNADAAPAPARPASARGQAATVPPPAGLPAQQAAPASSVTAPAVAPVSASAKATTAAAATLPSTSSPEQVTSEAVRPAAPAKPTGSAKQQPFVTNPTSAQTPAPVTPLPQQQQLQLQRRYKPVPTEPWAPATDSAPASSSSSSSSADPAAGAKKSSGARRGRRWL